MIQGSAAAYSKKVELLHGLVYGALEALTGEIGLQKRKSAKSGENGENVVELHFEERAFLPLDDLPEGREIDLDDDLDVEIGRHVITSHGASSASVFHHHRPGQGEGRFRLAECSVLPNGALLIDGVSSVLPASSSSSSSSSSSAAFAAASGLPGVEKAQPSEVEEAAFGGDYDANIDMSMGGGGGNDDLDVTIAEVDESVTGAPSSSLSFNAAKAGNKAVTLSARKGKKPKATPADPWAVLDPHVPGNTPARPFRKGRTSAPPSTNVLGDRAVKQKPVVTPAAPPSAFRSTYFPELAKAAAAETKRRLATHAGASKPDDEAYFDEEPAANHMDDGYGGGDAGGFDDLDNPTFAPGVEWNESAHPVSMAALSSSSAAPAANPFSSAVDDESYEELCKRHLDTYMSQFERFAAETALAKRVGDWESLLSPYLHYQESKPAFDIDQYAGALVRTVPTTPKAFKEVVKGEDRGEVCRLFLASLELANRGVLQVTQPNGVDSMTVKLLKKDIGAINVSAIKSL